jgi:hypothetical protein
VPLVPNADSLFADLAVGDDGDLYELEFLVGAASPVPLRPETDLRESVG